MFLAALSFLAGILSLNLFADLPGNTLYAALAVTAVVWYLGKNRSYEKVARCPVVFLFGMCWAQIHAENYLQHVLDEELAGTDVTIIARVSDIPVKHETLQRFVAQVEAFNADGYTGRLPGHLRLSWHYGEPVRAGETWRFRVRLKPPHGFMNPGGFDYEAWLFQRGIHGTGYVRDSELNRRLREAPLLDAAGVRQQAASGIATALQGSDYAGLVAALAVGDRAAIDAAQWKVLINTGTNHLMAISGLHIGLAAVFGYGLFRRLVPARVMRYLPAQHAAMIGALPVAAGYALLAGFAIPTQRALLMLVCVAGAALFRRNTRPLNVLFVALFLVLLWDPAAVLSAGFWFSFLAVAVIFLAVTGRDARSRWLQWGWIQLVIALALAPLSLYLFQQVSLVSPLANMIMVPFVSLLVVPLVLLGVLLMAVSETAAAVLLGAAARLFELVWPALQWLSDCSCSHWIGTQPSLFVTLMALCGIGVLLAPRIRRWRIAGVLLLVPVLAWRPPLPADGAFRVDILDVGQGLAVVVRTRSRTLVYDTGARFSDRLDSGSAVVLPFLRHEGIGHVDLLLISHGDSDHIGGAPAVLAAYPRTPLLGQGTGGLAAASSLRCAAGQAWEWDGVVFSVLHPDDAVYTATNNRSCVLRIEGRGGSVLMTGDIERKVEDRLLRDSTADLGADLLIAPHHGSNTSSQRRFIEAVSPQTVVFAAGYRNRYRFPASAVVRRYAELGVAMHVTGLAGTIRVEVDPQRGVSPVHRYRDTHRKYWHHRPPGLRQAG